MQESQFQFLGYKVTKISCEIKDDFFDAKKRSLSHNISIAKNFNVNNPRLIEIVLDVKVENNDKTFDFFLQIKGGFQADEKMSDKLFEKMSNENAPAILLPFARAIITSFTAQANIPPIILPLVNLTKSKE